MNLRYVAPPRVVRAAAPLVLPALLLTPGLASAQLAEEQVEPNLQILAPAELAVNINNFTFDYPEPYEDTYGFSIGLSLFETVDSLGNPVPLGVVYPEPPGVVGELSLTFTAEGSIRGCEPIVTDLTGKIAFIERGSSPPFTEPCYFNLKAYNAEEAGAVGVVIFRNDRTDDHVQNMSAGDSTLFVGIPAAFLPMELGLTILEALESGETVTGALCAYTDAGACFGVATEPGPRPAAFALSAAPNPSRGATTVRLSLAEAQAVHVEVFNALGQRVAVLHDGALAAGANHQLTLDGRDLPAGVYLVRATGEGLFAAQQISIVR